MLFGGPPASGLHVSLLFYTWLFNVGLQATFTSKDGDGESRKIRYNEKLWILHLMYVHPKYGTYSIQKYARFYAYSVCMHVYKYTYTYIL